MEAFAFFALTLGAIAANNAAVMDHYYGRYGYPAYYAQPAAVQPRWDAPAAVYIPVEPVVSRRAAAPVPRCSSSCSGEFIEHWQNFMEPSVSRSSAPLPGFGRGQRD
jgi:hypothetical protein